MTAADLLARLAQRPQVTDDEPHPMVSSPQQWYDYNSDMRRRAEFDRALLLDVVAEALEWFDEETPKDTVQAWRTIVATLRSEP
jgi:hypothetical protein